MILFVGEQDKGWFVPETAEKKNEKCEYSGFVSSLEELSKRILQGTFSAVILHLPSLVIMDYQNIGKFCKNLMIANGNIRIIVMAEGYNINSQIVQAAIAAGVRFFMLGTNASMLKNELANALDGKTNIEAVFEQFPTEDQRDRKKNEIESSFAASRTIAVAGSQHRIGTTTQALQIVKHLILEGHTACYIQLNSSDYVQKVGEFYTDAILNEDTGLVTYQNLEMYYKQERIADILAKNYDYYIYDFGCISDNLRLRLYLRQEVYSRTVFGEGHTNSSLRFKGERVAVYTERSGTDKHINGRIYLLIHRRSRPKGYFRADGGQTEAHIL